MTPIDFLLPPRIPFTSVNIEKVRENVSRFYATEKTFVRVEK